MREVNALLLTMKNPDGIRDTEFSAWLAKEHFPERLRIPGFRSALRFESRTSPLPALCVYDVDDISVLQSAAYQAISGQNNSPWTCRINAGASARWRFVGERSDAIPHCLPTGGNGTVSEVLIARWRGVRQRNDETVANAALSAAATFQHVTQVRMFVGENESGFDYVAVLEASRPFPHEIADPRRFDADAAECDFAHTFAPLQPSA
ncbi:hypothetical protein [Mycobacterium sp. AT1]|uniref:hypothetical protein n=1 Tax=Mycobacterium sp. AT1 TaxID=1961706 RepID=UPI0009ADC7D4|nr:hypothetical protein [Mycobacterium sp. AT1]OPX05896.1 hypothetical protein B1790_29955 [Mycobacterium sp. AT1]